MLYTPFSTPSRFVFTYFQFRASYLSIGRLRFHYNDNEYENDIFGADIIISCVLLGFIFVIVVVDDEMEATSCSSRCLQKRNKNNSDI